MRVLKTIALQAIEKIKIDIAVIVKNIKIHGSIGRFALQKQVYGLDRY